jgi:subtilisin family serine protease
LFLLHRHPAMLIHSFLLASTLCLAVSGVSATATADSADFFVPGRFIVEYQPELTKRSALTASDPHEDFHQALAAIHPAGGVRSHFNYSSPLFNGASFSIHDSPDAIARLKSLPNVLNIWPVKRFEILQTDATDMKQTSSSHTLAERNWNPHEHTGVAALHAKGLSGQNVTIAIIDTGVDYTHPALGGGIGPDYKIVGGYNFVGPLSDTYTNNKTGLSNSQIDQYNPLDCQGHGTHVAGIIAAKDDQNIVGVAPNATIRAYKIFGCSGGTSEDIVIAALQTAFRDGADIITASVGLSGQGLLDGPANLIASRLVEYGVFVSIAAGNSGIEGPRYPSSPGAGEYVTAVGSAESNAILTWNGTARSSSGESITFKYVTARGVLPNVSDTTFPVDFLADNADDCAALAARAVNGTALLLPLSSACENANLYTAAQDNGYKVVLRYTDNPLKYSVPTYSVQGFYIDVFGTAADLGAWARNQTKSGHSLTISLDTLAAQPNVIEADTPRYVSEFSTWGPHFENGLFYPALVAPGGAILSTWLDGRYSIMSGSSMATPYVRSFSHFFFNKLSTKYFFSFRLLVSLLST